MNGFKFACLSVWRASPIIVGWYGIFNDGPCPITVFLPFSIRKVKSVIKISLVLCRRKIKYYFVPNVLRDYFHLFASKYTRGWNVSIKLFIHARINEIFSPLLSLLLFFLRLFYILLLPILLHSSLLLSPLLSLRFFTLPFIFFLRFPYVIFSLVSC